MDPVEKIYDSREDFKLGVVIWASCDVLKRIILNTETQVGQKGPCGLAGQPSRCDGHSQKGLTCCSC